MKGSTRAAICCLLAAVVLAAHPRAATKRPITESGLYKFTWIADPQISRFAETVVFVQVR